MLELISIKKEYVTKAGNTVALNNVSLRFPETGIVFITGKSGSGKTTLLNIIGGLDGFDSGEIKLNGKSFKDFSAKDFDSYRNTFVGFVFQEYNLLPEFNVGKNVDIAMELQGLEPDVEKNNKLFEDVEISGLSNRKVTQLSGGQKQRVAIVRALVKNPKIILADELTGALDSATGEQVMEILKKLSKEKLVIVVSHDKELAEKYADRIIKIADGKVVEDITLKDLDIKGNIHQNEAQLTVKIPSELTEDENKVLLSAIKENKKISFTDKISVREKSKTIEPEVNEYQNVNFINSKMKFTSATALGFKSMLTKPVRLIFTILLSVIAFAVFGLFDSIASYNNAKVITELLREGTYSSLPLYSTYTDEAYNNKDIKISQKFIDSLNRETGYEFRGVYDLKDKDMNSFNKKFEIKNIGFNDASPQGWLYYLKTVNGLITFNKDEIKDKTIDTDGFNYSFIGDYPVFDKNNLENYKCVVDEKGNYEYFFPIAISSYLADSIIFWNNLLLENREELLDYKLEVGDFNFVIKAIVDCGEIPNKYDVLKIKTKEDKNLSNDFKTFIDSSCYLTLFAPEGFVDYIREINNRTTNYYSDTKTTFQKVHADGFENSFSGKYYNIKDIRSDNYIIFDGNTSTKLKDNEALIHVRDYINEYFKKETDLILNTDLAEQIPRNKELEKRRSAVENSNTKEEYISSLFDFYNYIKSELHLKQEDKFKTITIKNTLRQGGTLLNETEIKVVGVYFNIDTDIPPYSNPNNFEAIMVSSNTLKTLNVYEDQGIYSRIITPLFSNRYGSKIIGQKMDNDSGVNLNWFNNSILQSVQKDKVMINQVIDLILYLAIVLALFSVFMLFNYISVSISSKKQTIGILRTLGANKKNILTMFITEAIIISLIIGFISCAVSYIACQFINSYIVEVMNLTFKIALFDFRQVILILFASLITGVLSSLRPIIKVSKKKPVELIRTL